MRVEVEPSPAASTTVLGDWYANILRFGKQQCILCVSEKTLLPVLLHATEARLLPKRLPGAVFDVLRALSIPWSAIDREMNVMNEAVIGRTANRKLLGFLNEFSYAAPYRLAEGASLVDVALWLAETPCGPIGMNFPDRLTAEAFAESVH